jgi:hypothetical protein
MGLLCVNWDVACTATSCLHAGCSSESAWRLCLQLWGNMALRRTVWKMAGSGWKRSIQVGGFGSRGFAQSPDLTAMSFSCGAFRSSIACIPSRNYRRYHGKISYGSDNCNVNVVRHFREYLAAHFRLSWEGKRPVRTPIVTTRRLWFYHLISCTIWLWD